MMIPPTAKASPVSTEKTIGRKADIPSAPKAPAFKNIPKLENTLIMRDRPNKRSTIPRIQP